MRRFKFWGAASLIISFSLLMIGFYNLSRRVSLENGVLSPVLEWQRSFFGKGAEVSLDDWRAMGRKEKIPPLLEEIEGITRSSAGRWGVVICDLGSDECFGINQNEVFEAASVMKVLTACYLLDRVDKGELSLKQELGGKSLYDHLRLMINRSDNDSWYALSEFLGYGNIQKYGQELGMIKLSTQANSFSPSDIALVLKKLYRGEVVSKQLAGLLFSFMKDTETENRLPAGIPEGVNVYHKSGTFGHLIHDAGIVMHPDNSFVLVVMGKGTGGTASASKTIAEISERVYAFFGS